MSSVILTYSNLTCIDIKPGMIFLSFTNYNQKRVICINKFFLGSRYPVMLSLLSVRNLEESLDSIHTSQLQCGVQSINQSINQYFISFKPLETGRGNTKH